MSGRAVGALIAGIVGVVAPVAFFLSRYGLNDRVSGTSMTTEQLFELLGTVVVSFVCGIVSAWLLKSAAPTLGEVIRDSLADRGEEGRPRHLSRFPHRRENDHRAHA